MLGLLSILSFFAMSLIHSIIQEQKRLILFDFNDVYDLKLSLMVWCLMLDFDRWPTMPQLDVFLSCDCLAMSQVPFSCFYHTMLI